jgi:hypothetical protein
MSIRSITVLLLLVGCSTHTGGADSAAGPGTDSARPFGDGAGGDGPSSDAGAVSPPRDAGPPIESCLDLPPGQWQEITPPELHREWWCTPDFNPSGCGNPGDMRTGHIATYGAHTFAIAPSAPGTIYLGTSSLGFWRSTDCGAHWLLADGGGSQVDAGRNWTIAVDPNDAQTVYTTAGYGTGGVYKSVDGGATWQQMLPPNIERVASFVEKIAMDPGNSAHLTVSFHDSCLASTATADLFPPGTVLDGNLPAGAPRGNTSDGHPGWGCLAETSDAGAHWTLTTNAVTWAGLDGPGQAMGDAKTWFYATNSGDGIYLTTTGGVSPDGTRSAWTRVFAGNVPGSVYVAPDHTYYASGNSSIIHSVNGRDWTAISEPKIGLGSFNGSTPFVQGGTRLYAAIVSFSPPARYYVSDVSPVNFTELAADTSAIPNGGATLDFDARYGVLYSSNMVGGLWRLKP